MNDYCVGVAYATGYIANENGKQYLVVRNLDPWYPQIISTISKYKVYQSNHNVKRDGRSQWAIKAKEINSLPELKDIKDISGFCRAYIEIHGVLDMATAKSRKGNHFKKPRLRIYGTEEILTFINNSLPAGTKKIQYINNNFGKTCAINYQSAKEIADILDWIDGNPKNNNIWDRWKEIIDLK